jgi:hypothetical protein
MALARAYSVLMAGVEGPAEGAWAPPLKAVGFDGRFNTKI